MNEVRLFVPPEPRVVAEGEVVAPPVPPQAREPEETRGPEEVREEQVAPGLPITPSIVPPQPRGPITRESYLAVELGFSVTAMAAAAGLRPGHVVLEVTLALVCLVVHYHSGIETLRPGLPHAGKVIRDSALAFAFAATAVALGVATRPDLITSAAIVGSAGLVALGGLALRRFSPRAIRVLVVGDPSGAADAMGLWERNPRAHVVGVAVIAPSMDGHGYELPSPDMRPVGSLGEVAPLLETYDPDLLLVVPGDGVSPSEARSLSWELEGTGVALALQDPHVGIAPHRIDHTNFGGISLMHIRSSRASSFIRVIKQIADRAIAAALLVAVSPILLPLMIAIRSESPGSPLFRQQRVGQNGRLFTIWKLRTMTTDPEKIAAAQARNDGNGLLFKLRADPRVTRLGRLLRKFSLDELPQLINVVSGDMSLVGPRPALPDEVAQYSELERRRLAVRPGMTGLWQVSGRSLLARDRSAYLDVYYADNWRLCDDVAIGLRTVDAVVRPKGAW